MAKKVPKKLVRCSDYNGHDALFMMKVTDPRLNGQWDHENWTVIADAEYDHKTRTMRAAGTTYRVYSDWSVAE